MEADFWEAGMMDAVYEWIRSLAAYMILMTMVMNLLPDRKYEKYLQLFAGAVFLMLVISPFTDTDGLEAQIAGTFDRLTFRSEANLLRQEIEDADGARMQRLAEAYTDAAEQNIMAMAETYGLTCKMAETEMELSPGAELFGAVRQIQVVLVRERKSVEETVETETVEPEAAETEAAETQTAEYGGNYGRNISAFREAIGEYYGVDGGNIEITFEDE